MEIDMKKAANDFLIDIMKDATLAKDFVKEEIPCVVEQMLEWHFLTSSMCFSFMILLMISSTILFKIFFVRESDEKSGFSENQIGIIISYVLVIIVLMMILTCNLAWLKIYIAPKLYILEYIRELK